MSGISNISPWANICITSSSQQHVNFNCIRQVIRNSSNTFVACNFDNYYYVTVIEKTLFRERIHVLREHIDVLSQMVWKCEPLKLVYFSCDVKMYERMVENVCENLWPQNWKFRLVWLLGTDKNHADWLWISTSIDGSTSVYTGSLSRFSDAGKEVKSTWNEFLLPLNRSLFLPFFYSMALHFY